MLLNNLELEDDETVSGNGNEAGSDQLTDDLMRIVTGKMSNEILEVQNYTEDSRLSDLAEKLFIVR